METLESSERPSSEASARLAEMCRHSGSCAIAIGTGAASEHRLQRHQPLAQFLRAQIVERVEARGDTHGALEVRAIRLPSNRTGSRRQTGRNPEEITKIQERYHGQLEELLEKPLRFWRKRYSWAKARGFRPFESLDERSREFWKKGAARRSTESSPVLGPASHAPLAWSSGLMLVVRSALRSHLGVIRTRTDN